MMSLTGLSTKVDTGKTTENNGDSPEFDYPSFKNAKKQGEVIEKDGWHKTGSKGFKTHGRGCDCRKTTDKGAYRDVIVEINGYKIHYLHQHAILVENPSGDLKISSCDWRSNLTKNKLNQYLPNGYRVFQEDYDWYLDTPNETKDFTDGMTISNEERTAETL